jgi:hypothetical protein
MAVQYVANHNLLVPLDEMFPGEGQNILNALSGRLKAVRAWLDAIEVLEREGIQS